MTLCHCTVAGLEARLIWPASVVDDLRLLGGFLAVNSAAKSCVMCSGIDRARSNRCAALSNINVKGYMILLGTYGKSDSLFEACLELM